MLQSVQLDEATYTSLIAQFVATDSEQIGCK
jgi:hypothetical protein